MKEVLVGLLALLCGIAFIWGIGRVMLGKVYDKDETHPFTMGLAMVFAFLILACGLYVVGSVIILEFK